MTNSLYSTWDNQFYPDFAKQGSYLMQFDCNPDGSLTVSENFLSTSPRNQRVPCERTRFGFRLGGLHFGYLGASGSNCHA
jgi:hypothetical protein